MTRYKTLDELVRAIREDGLLREGDGVLVIDNDNTHFRLYRGFDEDASSETVFRMHPADLLEAALTLLGVPHEPA